jgi:hypothetical protein
MGSPECLCEPSTWGLVVGNWGDGTWERTKCEKDLAVPGLKLRSFGALPAPQDDSSLKRWEWARRLLKVGDGRHTVRGTRS